MGFFKNMYSNMRLSVITREAYGLHSALWIICISFLFYCCCLRKIEISLVPIEFLSSCSNKWQNISFDFHKILNQGVTTKMYVLVLDYLSIFRDSSKWKTNLLRQMLLKLCLKLEDKVLRRGQTKVVISYSNTTLFGHTFTSQAKSYILWNTSHVVCRY